MTSLVFYGVISFVFTFWIAETQTFADTMNSHFYTAGVVEFRPNLFGMSSSDMLADHLRAYEEIIRSFEANQTDIIVFPEGTLNNPFHLTYVPSAEGSVIPCLQPVDPKTKNAFAEFLVKLSCIARDVKKYLVINVTEKENCSTVADDPRPCASSDLNVYNTNVVFDREGRVISRYRKVHIYVEAKNTTYTPEYGIFETDFGVRFGHFICFDILFYTPAQELVTRFGITDFIFTSMFYSELPFLTATQLQQSWAWSNNVNLLAAGASFPEFGMTGSGIFAGNKGQLVSAMIGGTGVRQIYVSQVPIHIDSTIKNREEAHALGDRQTGIKLMKDPQIEEYTSELLSFSKKTDISRVLCYGSFCCNFHLEASLNKDSNDSAHYKYRIGVFDGRRTYEKKEWSDIAVCALYACTGDDVGSCGEIFEADVNVESNVVFETIEVYGEFEKTPKMLVMPNSLNDQLYSLNSDSVTWNLSDNGSHINVSYKLIAPNEKLLTFGIYAQYFERSAAKRGGEFFLSLQLIIIAVNMFT